jgi:hypothetical protein
LAQAPEQGKTVKHCKTRPHGILFQDGELKRRTEMHRNASCFFSSGSLDEVRLSAAFDMFFSSCMLFWACKRARMAWSNGKI